MGVYVRWGSESNYPHSSCPHRALGASGAPFRPKPEQQTHKATLVCSGGITGYPTAQVSHHSVGPSSAPCSMEKCSAAPSGRFVRSFAASTWHSEGMELRMAYDEMRS